MDAKQWSNFKDISIDYNNGESSKFDNCTLFFKAVCPGGWDAVWSSSGLIWKCNIDRAHAIDRLDTLLRSETEGHVGLGLENIMAIAMPDAVLVARKDKAQDVKKVVDLLKSLKIPQADVFPKDHRPWGWFESLALGNFFQVKRICVNPEAALSLQSHRYRSEHWIVVEGTAKVTIDDTVKFLKEVSLFMFARRCAPNGKYRYRRWF